MAAPAFRAAASTQTATGTTITPAAPAGLAENDIMFAASCCDNGTQITLSANGTGWTLIHDVTDGSTFRTQLWWKRAGASETMPTFQNTARTGTQHFRAAIAAYSGAATSGTPYESFVEAADVTAPATANAVTTTGADRLAVSIFNFSDNIATAPGDSFTENAELLSNVGDDGGTVFDSKVLASATTTAGYTRGSNAPWGTVVLALLPVAKVLVAAAGSYSVTGTAASLEFGREVVAAAGSHSVTGTAASLEYGREVAAAAGSYSVSGTAASLEFGRELVAGAGSYAISGTDAALQKTIPLVAGAGSYSITGTAAALEFARELAADAGSYAITGAAAALEHGREVVADAGAYAITGAATTLSWSGEVVAGADYAWICIMRRRRINDH